MSDRPVVGDISPTPSPEEVAAITAAIELTWPRPVVLDDDGSGDTPEWRFSGRWWRRPIAARRERPW